MSSNTSAAQTLPGAGSGSGSGSGSNSSGHVELVIAAIALVISVLAMFITTFQALQQYFSSATGQSSCSKKVIGKWAEFTELHFTTFRLEVRFRAPVLFVAPPENKRGPLGQSVPIHYMDGSVESYTDTHTWNQDEFDTRETQESIRTADNELSTWIALMMAIQRMEKESREWQHSMFFGYDIPRLESPAHSMAVGMQEKTRSWDTMPDGLLKPYATSTIAHMVEMMAMLGVHWKEFDRNDDKYRAQGNGFSVSGSLVPNLGIGFTFQKVGKTLFGSSRIVPHNSVKELCFGFCPTIFRDAPPYTDEPEKGTLQLGTSAEVAETLGSFGCNTNTINYFRNASDYTRLSHLFPLAFEMVGMVGAVLQIKHTAFTMLPNPTFLTWDKSSFSLPKLLASFEKAMRDVARDKTKRLCPGQFDEILKQMSNVQRTEKKDSADRREAKKQATAMEEGPIRASVAAVDAALNGVGSPPTPIVSWARVKRRATSLIRLAPAGNGRSTQPVVKVELSSKVAPFPLHLAALHTAIEKCDKFLTKPEIFPVVSQVFCLHFQEVLRYLNTGTKEGTSGTHVVGSDKPQDTQSNVVPNSPVAQPLDSLPTGSNEAYVSLEKLDSASSRERHRLLAEVYVHYIRKRIVKAKMPLTELDSREGQDELNEPDIIREEPEAPVAYQPTEGDVDDVWRTLIFRMLCWLMLHDFHKKDIQISKSDVFDSRLPVYIL